MSEKSRRQMLQQAYNNVVSLVPEIANVRYNFDRRTFELNGKPVSDQYFLERATEPGAREARAGRNTLKRAALQHTLVRAGGSETRERVLGELLRQRSHELDSALYRIAYSRTSPSTGLKR